MSDDMTHKPKAIDGEKYAIKLCEHLGIDPGRVSRLVVEATPGHILTITVTLNHAADILMDEDFPSIDDVRVIFGDDN
jgi:hypothetical protein